MAVEIVTKKTRELYGIAFLVGIVLMIGLLFINAWDLPSLISADYMLFLFSVSGITMKVLSGIGIMLSYASFCTIVFKLFSEGMKGNRSYAKRVKLVMLIPIVGIAAYGIYKIVGGYFAPTFQLLDILITIYGVWSLMLSVYIIPVARGEYQPEFKESTTDKIRKRFGDAKYSLWSGYQTRVHKEYGKVYAKEFERYGERLNKIRAQLSGILLLPLGIALLTLPPIVLPLFILWFRSFTLDKKPLSMYERGFLAVIAIGMMLLSTFIVLTLDVSSVEILLDFVYGLGILSSILVLAYIVMRA